MKLCFLLLLFPLLAFSELLPIDDSDLNELHAQSGITIETYLNSTVDAYYLNFEDETAVGGALKLEGLKIIQTAPDGSIPASPEPAAVFTDIDVSSDASGDNASLSVSSYFGANAAITIDALRLGSTAQVSDNSGSPNYTNAAPENFTSAYNNINGCNPGNPGCAGLTFSAAPSLGKVEITNLTGRATISVRGK